MRNMILTANCHQNHIEKGGCRILRSYIDEKTPSYIGSKSAHCNTVEWYGTQWLDHSKQRVKGSSYVKYYNILHKHILPGFAHLPMNQLTAEHLRSFSQELIEQKHLSPKTVKDILTVFKSVLKEAETNRHIPPLSCEIVMPKVPKKEIRVLSTAEQSRLVSYLTKQPDGYHLGILLSLFTGMRIGEICALRWRNVSLTQKIIYVDATMQRIKNFDTDTHSDTKVLIDAPKSLSSIRTIPLTSFTVQLLARYQNDDPNAFVLTGQAERYIEPRVLQYQFAKCARVCGIPDVHFHTLRHTFATRCAEVDFEIKSLSEVLGHSDPRITLDRYVHPSMELKRNNMEKLSAILC